jgi:hypothetical protein
MTCSGMVRLLKSFTICVFCEYVEWIDTSMTVKCNVYGLTTTKLICPKFKVRQEKEK